jgi:hypothetical protein
MGKVTQQDRAEAVEFVEGRGRVWLEKLQDPAMAEKAERALAVLNAGIAALETLAAAQKRAKEEATAASWFAEQNEIEQEKRRAAEAERDAALDTLASVKCCETCSDGGPQPAWNDCLCEYAEECHPADGTPLFGRWTPASKEQLSEWGRQAGDADDMRDKYNVAQARVRALEDRVALTRTIVGEMRNKRDAARDALASCRKALEDIRKREYGRPLTSDKFGPHDLFTRREWYLRLEKSAGVPVADLDPAGEEGGDDGGHWPSPVQDLPAPRHLPLLRELRDVLRGDERRLPACVLGAGGAPAGCAQGRRRERVMGKPWQLDREMLAGHLNRMGAAMQDGSSAQHIMSQAATRLRGDADIAERLRVVEAERDALARQVGGCRKALEWLRQRGLIVRTVPSGMNGPVVHDIVNGRTWGLPIQPEAELLANLSAAAQVQAEHLQGAPEGAEGSG